MEKGVESPGVVYRKNERGRLGGWQRHGTCMVLESDVVFQAVTESP
jgi:hypothetical protein